MESMDENPADNGDSTSEKGLKSDGTLTINSGTIVIDTVDDAIHSSGVLTVNGGEITITTGDDGLHSDVELLINDGTVNILKAYEGIEANQITVAGGDISVVTTDDGINANGGSASFGGPGGESRSSNAATDMPNLNITGGNIYVNSAGDGLDSNGDLTITGGYTVVDGPSDAGNGALDCGTEIGGKMIISGGVLFAGGSAAMVELFDSTSAQASVKCILPSVYSEGTIIKVTGADGTVYFEHKARSTGNSIIFSCPELKTADTFTLTVGDAEYEITLSSVNAQFNISADGTIEEGASTGAMAGMPGGSREQMGEYKE